MAQYISKSALVAEIERLIKSPILYKSENVETRIGVLKYLLSFLETFEVKEVDLEKEIKEVQRNYKTIDEYEGYPCTMYADDIKWIAKHFYELGLRYNSSYVSTPNIDDTLKEIGVDPDSKLSKNFKESYFRVLDELQTKQSQKKE